MDQDTYNKCMLSPVTTFRNIFTDVAQYLEELRKQQQQQIDQQRQQRQGKHKHKQEVTINEEAQPEEYQKKRLKIEGENGVKSEGNFVSENITTIPVIKEEIMAAATVATATAATTTTKGEAAPIKEENVEMAAPSGSFSFPPFPPLLVCNIKVDLPLFTIGEEPIVTVRRVQYPISQVTEEMQQTMSTEEYEVYGRVYMSYYFPEGAQ